MLQIHWIVFPRAIINVIHHVNLRHHSSRWLVRDIPKVHIIIPKTFSDILLLTIMLEIHYGLILKAILIAS